MEEQDRVSQTSSMATISSLPLQKHGLEKLQAFGKRFKASKRDPNCPVVIRGWLNKKDSSGLKLWKRRWFVLSNYCLFYYKDSREESVLGSIPLPSYNILFCSPRECKNRKYTFKVVHQGMRLYFFCADTQEDMLGWVRALSQAAAMEPDGSLNRRCCSYQDFTQIGGSSESVGDPHGPTSEGDGFFQKPRHVSRTLSEPSHLTGGRLVPPNPEHRARRPSSSPSRGWYGLNPEEDSSPRPCDRHAHSKQTLFTAAGPVTSRGQLGSRPHTPVGRVDIRPQNDPMMMYYAPPSPKHEFRSQPHSPILERWQNLSQPVATYGSVHHAANARRTVGKSLPTGAFSEMLPPLPPTTRVAHGPHHHHHHHHGNHVSVCLLPSPQPVKSDMGETPPMRPLENDADAVLTRLCGCDKLLQSLSMELAQLQVDKISVAMLQDSVQVSMEMNRLQLEEWRNLPPHIQEAAITQKALLQEELVTIRTRMCDVSLEMERVWSQYERRESELSVIRSQLQHICNFGLPQHQSQAQRDLWMMEDVLAALKPNRDHLSVLLGLYTHHVSQTPAVHPHSPSPPSEDLQVGPHMGAELQPPARPPLPQELQEANQGRDPLYEWTDLTNERREGNLFNSAVERRHPSGSVSGRFATPDLTITSNKQDERRAEEDRQVERMKRSQERSANRKKPPMMSGTCVPRRSRSSEPREEAPFPLRVTRVVTAVLPSSLVARRVSVEEPPPELAATLPEHVPAWIQPSLGDQNRAPGPPAALETSCQNRFLLDLVLDRPVRRQTRTRQGGTTCGPWPGRQQRFLSREESSRQQEEENGGCGEEGPTSDTLAQEMPCRPLTQCLNNDPDVTPGQREAKLRRVERIRERVIRSAARESAITPVYLSITSEKQEVSVLTNDGAPQSPSEMPDGLGVCHHGNRSPQRDEEDLRSRSQHPVENRTQICENSVRRGSVKHKNQPAGSSCHSASVTLYQREDGSGFSRCSADGGGERPSGGDTSRSSRAMWFLSTNQWQGFIPLQHHGIEPLCDQEVADINYQPEEADSALDIGNMPSAVNLSLEKMKENHSLFYKIACDISISDTDIAKGDGNSNPQTTWSTEEGAPAELSDAVPEGLRALDTQGQGFSPTKGQGHSSSTRPMPGDSEDVVIAESPAAVSPEEPSDDSRQMASELPAWDEEGQEISNVSRSGGNGPGEKSSEQGADPDEPSTKGSETMQADQQEPRTFRKASSLCGDSNGRVRDEGNRESTGDTRRLHDVAAVIRGTAFGKARMTVLRTSL